MKKYNKSRNLHSGDMAQVGLICAVLCVVSPLAIVIPISPVPISFSLIAVYLAVYVSGCQRALMGVAVYLMLGGIGLPVFAGGMAGPGRLLGPTGGYLAGYLVAVLLFGQIGGYAGAGLKRQLLGMLCGLMGLYALGTAWLMFQSKLTLTAAVYAGVLPYLPADIVKIIFTSFLGRDLRRRLGNYR